MCKAVKRATLRPERDSFALAVQLLPSEKKKDIFHFGAGHQLETMKYEVRNKMLSLKRLNYRNTTGRVSLFGATGKLHAMLNSG